MKDRLIPMFSVTLVSVVCLAAEPAKSADANDGWKLATERSGVTIYSRPHSGSFLKEFKAVGEIAAPSRAVCEVIEDVDAYPRFMPYMTECRLLRREGDSLLSYQRISPKICSDRDFTLRTYKTSCQASPDLSIRTGGRRRMHWARRRNRALCRLSSARGPGCSNRAAPAER